MFVGPLLYMRETIPEMAKMLEILKTRFGYPGFKAGQEEVVRDVLAGGHRLVVLPTGGGKSLCYVLPAVLRAGKTLVVSPLIALMEDQAERAASVGLRALVWRRETTRDELLQAGMIFASPEKLMHQAGPWLGRLGIWHLVIDEAHCVEDWGGSFRPMYTQLAGLQSWIEPYSLSVFTASAGEEQRASLVRRLGLRDARCFVHGFDRPNIAWHSHQTAFPLLAALHILRKTEGRAIVYCRTRLGASRSAAVMQASGMDARPFHAGMRRDVRMHLQREFLEGRIRILCATSAFGMGVDVPAVRTVIHLGLPSGRNAYYQESGRAGRDGQSALAVLLTQPGEQVRLDAVERRNRVLLALIRQAGDGWTQDGFASRLRVLGGGQEPAEMAAFLVHHGICRMERGGSIIPLIGAGERVRMAIREDMERRAEENRWIGDFVSADGGCRRKHLVGGFEDVSGLVCHGCDACGSEYSEMLARILGQTATDAEVVRNFVKLPWLERPALVFGEQISVLREEWSARK